MIYKPRRIGGYIASEANGSRSREQGTLAAGRALIAGLVIGQNAAGRIVPLNHAGTDGSQTVVGISFGNYQAPATDDEGVVDIAYTARDAEVEDFNVVLPDGSTAEQAADVWEQLAALNIRPRTK